MIEPAPLSSRTTLLFTVAMIAVTALLVLYLNEPNTILVRDPEGSGDNLITDNAKALSPGFNSSRELDFAVIGFPKTGE